MHKIVKYWWYPNNRSLDFIQSKITYAYQVNVLLYHKADLFPSSNNFSLNYFTSDSNNIHSIWRKETWWSSQQCQLRFDLATPGEVLSDCNDQARVSTKTCLSQILQLAPCQDQCAKSSHHQRFSSPCRKKQYFDFPKALFPQKKTDK